MKLATVAKKGNTLDTLRQLRQRLAQAIDESKSGRDIASLSRQLQLVMAQIKELEGEERATDADNLIAALRAKHTQVRDPNRCAYLNYSEAEEDEEEAEDEEDEDETEGLEEDIAEAGEA